MHVNEKSYVEWVHKEHITIVLRDRKLKEKVISLGGRRQFLSLLRWNIGFASTEELGNLFSSLRDSDVCFAGGPAGWPPAAIFKDLRKKGLVAGCFNEIIWRGKNEFEIWSK